MPSGPISSPEQRIGVLASVGPQQPGGEAIEQHEPICVDTRLDSGCPPQTWPKVASPKASSALQWEVSGFQQLLTFPCNFPHMVVIFAPFAFRTL